MNPALVPRARACTATYRYLHALRAAALAAWALRLHWLLLGARGCSIRILPTLPFPRKAGQWPNGISGRRDRMTSSAGSTCTICDRKASSTHSTHPPRERWVTRGAGGRAGGDWGGGRSESPGRPGTRPQTPSPFRHPSPFILVDMRELSTGDPSAGREGVATTTHPLRVVDKEWACDGQWLVGTLPTHLACRLALNGLQGFLLSDAWHQKATGSSLSPAQQQQRYISTRQTASLQCRYRRRSGLARKKPELKAKRASGQTRGSAKEAET